jgi:hypothetical protein
MGMIPGNGRNQVSFVPEDLRTLEVTEIIRVLEYREQELRLSKDWYKEFKSERL